MLSTIDEIEYNVLLWLLELLYSIQLKSEVNNMTAKNLAIVFAPNLYLLPNDISESMELLQYIVSIIEMLILSYTSMSSFL